MQYSRSLNGVLNSGPPDCEEKVLSTQPRQYVGLTMSYTVHCC
jgi:hypothetical protein